MRFWRKRDAYLSQTVTTERFELVPCGLTDAFNLTWLWTRDPEILTNMTFDSTPRTKVGWYRSLIKPNNYDKFTHAIIPRGKRGVIGLHRIRLVAHKTAMVEIALHNRKWWGRGVFAEVRASLMDHFFASDRVERFQASVQARNFSSVFNYKKLGYRCAGIWHRAQFDPQTETHFDILLFEMLQEDWEKLKEDRR